MKVKKTIAIKDSQLTKPKKNVSYSRANDGIDTARAWDRLFELVGYDWNNRPPGGRNVSKITKIAEGVGIDQKLKNQTLTVSQAHTLLTLLTLSAS